MKEPQDIQGNSFTDTVARQSIVGLVQGRMQDVRAGNDTGILVNTGRRALLGPCAKNGCALAEDSLAADLVGSPGQSAIRVMAEVATKMARDFTNSFEFALALLEVWEELTGVFPHHS
jgi:hypothetical protein